LALHVMNVWLAWALVMRIASYVASGFSWISAFAVAAIWAVHPLSTEAVTNIVGRADLIAGFAVLSSVLLYARSRETTGARRWMSLVALTVVTTIGVFAKESAVVIVGVAMLFAICFRSAETSRSKKAFSIADGARGLRRASVALAVPLLLLWIQRTRILGA